MRWKIFQWVKFLFWRSSNLRKLSRQKFYNELACIFWGPFWKPYLLWKSFLNKDDHYFTAHDARKNAEWNQQQLTDGGILANWNCANHPYCFLPNQKKVQTLAFLRVIRQRNVSCPLPVRDLKRFQILMFFEKFLIDHMSSRLCKWYPFIHDILPSLLHPGKAG